MPSSNVCWGIEVGAGAIKAIKLESDGEGVRVVDFAIVPHSKVLSTPDLDQNDALRVALGALASQYDLSGATIAVSVPGHAGFARFAKLPPVEPKKVPDIVKFEAVQQIPFPLEDVEWDYQTFVSPDSPDVEVGIFAITKDRIRERLDMLADVGIVPQIVTLGPVAAYNALAFDLAFTEQTAGTILLDIGTTSTDLVIAESGRVWIRTFPIGGHQFTNALVEAFKLTYPKAEKVKREADTSKAARQIMQAMRPVFQDLVQDVQRSVGYYQSLHREAKLTRLIGLGSTFNLPGLRKFLKQQLQLDVYRMEEFKRLKVEGDRASGFNDNVLTLATAYGCAIQGLGMNAINANLMPTAILRTTMWKNKQKWFATAAGLAVAATGAMFIRPMLDSSAVAGAPRPRAIDDAVSAFKRAQSEATAAGVVGAAGTNLTAANIITLMKDREVYPHLANDLALMVRSADARATTGSRPVLRMVSYKTNYLGVVTPRGESGSDPYEDRGGGRGRGRVEELRDGDAPAGPTIEVEIVFATPEPQVQQFYRATIGEWLDRNRARAGVPYVIVPPEIREVVFAEAKPSTPTRPAETLTFNEGGRETASEGEGRRFISGPQTPARPVVQIVGEGGPAASMVEETAFRAANEAVEVLAPIVPDSPPGYPDEARITVKYRVVVKPTQAAESEDGL
ncbi:MAG: type IV pilus assembly protein PilM [Phycisphaeraceae bacterium]|nr:type IV pilus assembly protein PilM [Phycisphaeraceae bacterium]MBX3366616.1 type IV pilus assembly protein PilM [Phycisphaeraceae bacterium]